MVSGILSTPTLWVYELGLCLEKKSGYCQIFIFLQLTKGVWLNLRFSRKK